MFFLFLSSFELSIINFNGYGYVLIERIKSVVKDNFVFYKVFKLTVKSIDKNIVVVPFGFKG